MLPLIHIFELVPERTRVPACLCAVFSIRPSDIDGEIKTKTNVDWALLLGGGWSLSWIGHATVKRVFIPA